MRESEAEKSVLEEDLKQRKEDFEEKKAQLDRFTENQSSMGAQLDSLNDEISRAEEKMKKMDQNMGTAKKIKMECIDRCEKERKELEEKKNDLLEFEKHASKRSTFKSLEAAEAQQLQLMLPDVPVEEAEPRAVALPPRMRSSSRVGDAALESCTLTPL